MSFKHWCFLGLTVLVVGCDGENRFARSIVISSMSEVIGGPTATARPGDYLLENDQIRAIVHGRHNSRGTMPVSNGSLIDLDIQRPHLRYGVGKGKDAFYELGPMINLKVNSSNKMSHGPCESEGTAKCPTDEAGRKIEGCARVSATGHGDNIMGILGLLDMAIKKPYPEKDLELVNDYDICPGEKTVRVTTTARFFGPGEKEEMPPLAGQTSVFDMLLGEQTGFDCAKEACPGADEVCEDLLIDLSFGSLSTTMKRCRKPSQKRGGVASGDFMFFSGKVNVFVPGHGFDNESYIQSVFDTGGDVFSNPLTMDFVAGVADGVSYAYFGEDKAMVPVFSSSFTMGVTNWHACTGEDLEDDPECFGPKGSDPAKELFFKRYVSVGQGDIASALEGYYKVRGVSVGEVQGHVIDARTREPVSGMNIFAVKVPQAWESMGVSAIAAKSYEELIAANQEETKTDIAPRGETGVVSHFRSDVGLDTIPDGSFGGALPTGRYVLVAADKKRPFSRLVPIKVGLGRNTEVTVIAAESATLVFQIQDASGRTIPSKLTIGHCFAECAHDEDCNGGTPVCDLETMLCVPTQGYQSSSDCRPDQVWNAQKKTCTCPSVGLLPLELGGSRFADGTVLVVQTAGGKGKIELPPSRLMGSDKEVAYEVVVSRGLEYETSRHFVTLRPATTTPIVSVLRKTVDTEGWISADFHVHGSNSVDSGLPFKDRVISYAAEGVKFLSSSDHDYLTDYWPTINELGLQSWVATQVGVEVSPLDYGHFLGFPLRFDENAEMNGAFHWREQGDSTNKQDWENLSPNKIFSNLRELGTLGEEETVVAVAHFYDHFTFYGLDPWTLELPVFSVNSIFNRVLEPGKFSAGFNALEVFNGKNFDLIRRPTWREVRDFNSGTSALLLEKGTTSVERQKKFAAISTIAQREFLRRTKEEQVLAIEYNNRQFQCRCTSDEECGGSSICDDRVWGCVSGCTSDSDCQEELVTEGRETCSPVSSTTPDRKICQRVNVSCTKDEDCTVVWKKMQETCMAMDTTRPDEKTCELSCEKDDDCSVDGKRPVCDLSRKICAGPVAVTDADPCPILRGTMDDWFQMLNRGVYRTVIGDSDSHDTYATEAGIPRNYVMSSTDVPMGIRQEEVAREIHKGHVFPTYGPFVSFQINGKEMGETVVVEKGDKVSLKIKVQSPLWFDVDRIEIYRNGELIREISGRLDCPKKSNDCIRVPNDQGVNYDATILDKPAKDSWYVVVAMGLDGKSLAPVYSSPPVARLGIFEIIQRLTPWLPPLRSMRTPLSPAIGRVRPYATTNPIFVDIGGDGITPVAPRPSWAKEENRTSSNTNALTSQRQNEFGPENGPGLGRMRQDAASFMEAARQGQISTETWRIAL
ncbi:MAG: hypothetical protein V1754_07370, partial [Pseudomonadota bacterium]